MGVPSKKVRTVVSSALALSLLALAGCTKPSDPVQPKTADAPATAPVSPYTPPTADQLSQMVAPIALFPDKLVGQVLAGATYPEQISAANRWLGQNPSLKGDALQSAEASQPWDVSVKALTTFPSVLSQMAGNIQWTTAPAAIANAARFQSNYATMSAAPASHPPAQRPGGAMSVPHFTAHDAMPGARPFFATPAMQAAVAPRVNAFTAPPHNERSHGAAPAPVKHVVVAKHEDNHHHDKHDGQERHG